MVVVIPYWITGPSLLPGDFTSADMVIGLFNGSKTEVATTGLGIVDVRDLAKCHVEAVRKPEAANQRFCCHSGEISYWKEIADWLDGEFGPQGYTVTTQEAAGERVNMARLSNQKAR